MRLKCELRRALSRAGAGGVFGVMMLAGAALAAPASVPADADGAQLAKSRICLGCHQPASKLVGPAFTSVAERYASMGDPVAYLSVSIRQGGRGRWGVVPMPAQPQVSEDEARRLAQWILSLR